MAGLQSGVMSEHEHWQLDGSAPQLCQRYLVPAITSHWAEDLVARSLPSSGETVLDLACGTGAVARAAADRMSYGRVVGLNLNAGMLEVARSVPSGGAAIEWLEGSALDLPLPVTRPGVAPIAQQIGHPSAGPPGCPIARPRARQACTQDAGSGAAQGGTRLDGRACADG